VVQRLVHHLAEPAEGAEHRQCFPRSARRPESQGGADCRAYLTRQHDAVGPDAILHGGWAASRLRGATRMRKGPSVGRPFLLGEMTNPKSHEATLRKADYDRYLAAMLAPSSAQPYLFALYASNYEVARIAEGVREPMAGHIRLQWWRDAIEGAYARSPLPHPVVQSLADMIAAHDPPREMFEQLLDAREHDLEEMPFA